MIASLSVFSLRQFGKSCAVAIRDDLKHIQLAQLLSPNGTVWQVTEPTASAAKRLKLLKIKPPAPIVGLA